MGFPTLKRRQQDTPLPHHQSEADPETLPRAATEPSPEHLAQLERERRERQLEWWRNFGLTVEVWAILLLGLGGVLTIFIGLGIDVLPGAWKDIQRAGRWLAERWFKATPGERVALVGLMMTMLGIAWGKARLTE